MKRTMTTALMVGLFATAAMAVESVNTVGYQALTLSGNNYSMVAVNWDTVGGGSLTIGDLFDTSAMTGGSSAALADNILIWDPITTGYTTYFLYDSGGVYPSYDGKWVDQTYAIQDGVAMPAGTAVWLLNRSADSPQTIAGQVPTVATVNTTLNAGNFTMVGSAYAAPADVNDGTFDWIVAGAVGGSSAALADNILIWDPITTGYTTYFLYDSGGVYPSYDGKWVDQTYAIISDAIPMGEGAWYLSRGVSDITWTQTKPY